MQATEEEGADVELQIDDAGTFQRREWVVQMVGTGLLTLFVLAGLVGLVGAGPLSSSTVTSPDGLVTVEHERVIHHEADESITLTFAPEAVEAGTITVELTGSWPGGIDLQSITPEPAAQIAVPGGIVLELDAEPTGEVEVSFSFRAQQHLDLEARVAVGDDSVLFHQLVLP